MPYREWTPKTSSHPDRTRTIYGGIGDGWTGYPVGMDKLSTFSKVRESTFPRRISSKLNHSLSLHVLTCPVQFSKSLESLGLGSKRHSLWIWQPEHYLEEWTCLIISFFLHNTTLSWWDGGNQRMWAAKYDRNFYYVNIWYKHILIVFGNSAPTCGVFLSKCCLHESHIFSVGVSWSSIQVWTRLYSVFFF
jgi:hypothetical protein